MRPLLGGSAGTDGILRAVRKELFETGTAWSTDLNEQTNKQKWPGS